MGTSKGNYGRKMYSDPLWKAKVSRGHKLSIIEATKKCPKCLKDFLIKRKISKNGEPRVPRKERRYCSRRCANSKTLTQEWKNAIGRALSKTKETGACKKCGNDFIKRQSSQKYCSKSCASSDREYLHRGGNRSEYLSYRKACQFKFNIFDFPDNFNLDLIKTYGWYKAKNRGNNQNGISRDHIISIDYGFKNNVPAEVLSHPANCQLIRHSNNQSKGKKCGITLEELTSKIALWSTLLKGGRMFSFESWLRKNTDPEDHDSVIMICSTKDGGVFIRNPEGDIQATGKNLEEACKNFNGMEV